jgi:hypothetical protein
MNERATKHGEAYAYARYAPHVPPDHIGVPEVHEAVVAAGKTVFGKGGFVEAFGGNRCRLPPRAWYWQVTYVNGTRQRFLPRECLKHLDELSDATR